MPEVASGNTPMGLAKKELAQEQLQRAAERIGQIDTNIEDLRAERDERVKIIAEATQELQELIGFGKDRAEGVMLPKSSETPPFGY